MLNPKPKCSSCFYFSNIRDRGEWKKGNEAQRSKRKEAYRKVGRRAEGGR
jgi:hypothetical protein